MSSSSSLLWRWQNQIKMNLLLDTTTNPYVSYVVGLRVDRKIMRKQCSDVFGCHARVLTKFHSFIHSNIHIHNHPCIFLSYGICKVLC